MKTRPVETNTEPVPAIDASLRQRAAIHACSLLGLCTCCGADVFDGEKHKPDCDAGEVLF
jgi:hypothetical protein